MINISAERFGELLDAEARLAEVEAERDLARENSLRRLEANIALRARAEAAEARLVEVEALHCPRGRNIHGDEVCAECSPLRPMPCPTLRAARGEGDRGNR